MSRDLSAIDGARAALALVHDDPAAVERRTTDLMAATDDPEARQLAAWARGRARHERGRFAAALDDLSLAARLAGERGDLLGAARIEAHRALTEYAVGDVEAALASLARAEPLLSGPDAGHLHLQRAIIEVHSGELVRARRSFDSALELLRAAGDDKGVARCLASRGVASTYLGDFDAAVADLAAAADSAAASGQRLVAAGAVHNLGYVRARLGELPAALALLEQAGASYRELGSPARVVASLDQDRAEVLLQAGLADEAVAAASAALARHQADGAHAAADDARLLLAEAELAAERPTAAATAEEAALCFEADGRAAWAARARYVGLRADLSQGEASAGPSSPELFERSCVLAGVLEEAGWLGESVDVWTFAGQVALARGRADEARGPLARAEKARRAGPLASRVRGWQAAALHRLARGDVAGARRATLEGLRLVAAHRGALVAPELRAGASARGVELARFGLRLAVRDGRPSLVFSWIEQTRARALATRIMVRGEDRELRALLGQLRAAHSQLRSSPASAEARGRVAGLEDRIRQHDHARTGDRPGPAGEETLGLGPLRSLLDGRAFVSFAELDGRLLSVAVIGRRTGLADHGTVAPARASVERLRFALQRLARPATARGAAATVAALHDDRTRLDELLDLGRLGAGPVVVSPSAALNGVPWGALPSLEGRTVTVTPSATVWASAPADGASQAGACFVAGPGLAAAAGEVRAAAALYPGATVIEGDRATVGGVVAAFAAHRIVHVAAHGTFRSDSPLFSGLELFDGALTLFDLDGLARGPEVVVLPACHLGTARVLPGDEPLGPVASLVDVGVRTVVAPVGPVPDQVAAEVMVELHRHMAAGRGVAEALAAVSAAALASDDPRVLACAASFVAAGRR